MTGMYLLLTTFLRFGLGHDLVRHERRLQPRTRRSEFLQTKRNRNETKQKRNENEARVARCLDEDALARRVVHLGEDAL